MDYGQFIIKNISGADLNLRGYIVADQVSFDLLSDAVPDSTRYIMWHQAVAAWEDDGTWLGASRVTGELELVLSRRPDRNTWGQ